MFRSDVHCPGEEEWEFGLRMKQLQKWPLEGRFPKSISSQFVAVNVKKMPTTFPNVEAAVKSYLPTTFPNVEAAVSMTRYVEANLSKASL